jgi:hypothetical protein
MNSMQTRSNSPTDKYPPKVMFISGGPGTGKTFTTNKIIQQLLHDHYKVLVTASTAVASLRFTTWPNMHPPTTVHNALKIPRDGQQLQPLQIVLRDPSYQLGIRNHQPRKFWMKQMCWCAMKCP